MSANVLRSATSTVRRRASVGWAVSTRPIDSRSTERLDLLRLILGEKLADGRLERAFLSAGRGPGALSDAANPVLLLGQVGQMEVQAEGLDERLDLVDGELLEDCAQAHLRVGLGVLADVDGEPADPFDELSSLLARLLGDDLAEQ